MKTTFFLRMPTAELNLWLANIPDKVKKLLEKKKDDRTREFFARVYLHRLFMGGWEDMSNEAIEEWVRGDPAARSAGGVIYVRIIRDRWCADFVEDLRGKIEEYRPKRK